jgi:hypothetical protein
MKSPSLIQRSEVLVGIRTPIVPFSTGALALELPLALGAADVVAVD